MSRLATLVLAALGASAATLDAQVEAPPQTFDWAGDSVPAATPWGQPIDVESTRLILSWTTAPEYTSELVDHLPDGGPVVSPTDHFGHPIGMPGVLHRTAEVHAYFRALAASTPRVAFEELGETEEGNRLGLVQVGSERTIQRLAEIRAAYARLADPRVAGSEEANALIADLPAVYLLTAGLHSQETGPPEMVMELAYRLAVSDDPSIREIRDSVLVLIVPVAEPDGRNRVVDWYRLHYPTADTTGGRVPGPPYWGKYIFHDNNRDGLQLTARLTQEVVGVIRDWNVPVAHDLHESVPYLYTSTGTGPYNPVVDAIAVAEWTWFANYEVTALTAMGMPGVWTHGFYDGWNPTYLIWAANTRNGLGRFYETFGNSVPWTRERDLGRSATSVEWYRPNPPRDTTLWSLRNNTNYMQTGVLTALSLTARNRQRLLRQFRTKAENALRKGRTEAPYAYVIPRDQHRRADVAYMLDLLGRQGVEVHRASEDGEFAADPALWPDPDPSPDPAIAGLDAAEAEPAVPADAAEAADRQEDDAANPDGDSETGRGPDGTTVSIRPGDFVIRMDQPYRNLALTLMQVQDFPDDAPRPYDDVAWTFPLMFGATVHPVTDSAVLDLAMAPVAGAATLAGGVSGSGSWWAVAPTGSAYSLAARLGLGDTRVWAAEDTLRVAGTAMPPGTWLVRSRDLPVDRARPWAARFGLDVLGVTEADVSDIARHELDPPRIALLHTWHSTQAEGWVRYTLDHFGVPYTYLADTELRDIGDLRRRFDVVLFPDQGGNAESIIEGIDPEDGPLPYRSSRDAPSLGTPDATDDMTGGMGLEGLIAIRDFVHGGGTFIGLRTASTVPAEFGLVRGVDVGGTPPGLFVPGSLVRGEVTRPRHPVTYGFGDGLALHHRFGPYFDVDDDLESSIVVRYAERELALSGLVQNPSGLAGEPAILSVPSGEGHYVLFGFNPLNRHQNFMDFGLVWNAILNWNDLDVGIEPEPDATAVTDGVH